MLLTKWDMQKESVLFSILLTTHQYNNKQHTVFNFLCLN